MVYGYYWMSAFMLLWSVMAFAQSDSLQLPDSTPVYTVAETMPLFPGCANDSLTDQETKRCSGDRLLKFIYSNYSCPKEAKELLIDGPIVVGFTINKKGRIQDIELIKNPGGGMGEELVRVIQLLQQKPESWTPATIRGRPVNLRYILPVRLHLRYD